MIFSFVHVHNSFYLYLLVHKECCLISVQASCGQTSAMEEMHKKMIEDLQQQHRTEVAALLKEKDQLLQEETAATMAGEFSFVKYEALFVLLQLTK